MIEVLVYKKNNKWRAVVGNVIFVHDSEGWVIDAVRNYIRNLEDFYSVAFYYEKQQYPFMVSTFAKKEI